MGKEWFGMIGVLVGGGITLIITFLKQKHDDHIENKRLYLSKIETLHEVLSGVTENYKMLSLYAIHWLIHGHRHEISAQNFIKSYKKYKTLPIGKLRMLIGIYAPKLKDDLLKIEDFDKGFETIIKKSFHAKTSGEKNKLKELIEAKDSEIQAICIKLQEKVVSHTHKFL